MEAVVKRWGNSLGVRIPGSIARGLSLRDGSSVDIGGNGNEIIIKPVRRYCLTEMLNGITKENMHAEISTGEPVGNEIW